MKFFTLFLAILLAPNCSTRKHTKSPLTPNTQASANSTEGLSLLGPPDAQASAFTLGNMEIPALFLNQYPGTEYPYTICLQSDPKNCETGTLAWGSRLFPKLKPGTYIAKVKSCARASASDRQLHCGLESVVSLHAQSVPDSQRELAAMVDSGVEISDQIRKLAVDLQTALQTYRQTVPSDSSRFSQSVDTLLNNGANINAELLNSSLIPSLYLAVKNESPLSASKISSNKKEDAAISDLRKQLQDLKNAQSSKAGTSVGTVLIAVGVSTTIIGAIVTGVGFAADNLVGHVEDKVNIYKTIESQLKDFNTAFNDGLRTVDPVTVASKILEQIIASPSGYRVILDEDLLHRKLGKEFESLNKVKISDSLAIFSANGKVKYFLIGEEIHLADNGLKLENQSINEHDFGQLSDTQKADFVRKGELFVLKEELIDKVYVEYNGMMYRKTPMFESIFPDLSHETLDALSNAWLTDKSSDYGKGIIFRDRQNRIVEPPDHWKVAGKNWPYDYSSLLGGKVAAPVEGELLNLLKDPLTNQVPERVFENPAKVYRWVDKGPSGLAAGIYKVNGWNAFLGTQWARQAMEQQIEGLKQQVLSQKADMLAKQHDAIKSMRESINSVPDNLRKVGKQSKKIGGATMLAGLGGVIIGTLAQLSLAANPAQEQLEKTLKVFDTKLSELHQQRLALALKVSEWLQKHDLAIPDPEWLSHL